MSVIFPDSMACLAPNTFQMPYLDPVLDAVVYWNPPATGSLFGNIGRLVSYGNTVDMVNQVVSTLSWLNYLNPQWRMLYDPTSATASGPAVDYTEYTFDLPQVIAFVTVTLLSAAKVDYWWGTSVFAKFGFFSWLESDLALPQIWINFKDMVLVGSDIYNDFGGFATCGAPGCAITVVSYSRQSLPYIQYAGTFFEIPVSWQ